MKTTAEVVIIGAGVIGCSTAYHLARLGVRDVVVLEMAQVGAGSTSKSAAMLSLQFGRDPLLARLGKQAYGRYQAFEQELGVPIDFRQIGWLAIATEDSAEALRQQALRLQALEITTELLTPEEVHYRYPELNTSDIVLGTWGSDDGSLDPHMILSGYLKQARRLGVNFYEGVKALGIEVDRGRISGVLTDHGSIACRVVINAAGPWAAQLAGWIGEYLPLLNSKRSIVVTHPIAAIPSDRPFVEDTTPEWYFRPELNGVLMGMGADPADDLDVKLDQAQVDAIIEHAVWRVPVLEQAALQTAWTGVRPLTPDGRAIVGPSSRLDGFFYNSGWGGVGIILGPLAGQLAADFIINGEIDPELAQALSPGRFKGNRF